MGEGFQGTRGFYCPCRRLLQVLVLKISGSFLDGLGLIPFPNFCETQENVDFEKFWQVLLRLTLVIVLLE